MPWASDPREIPFSGTGNMSATVKPGRKFRLAYIRCHFRRLSGSGTDVANLTLNLDSALGDDFDILLALFESVGVAADVIFRVNDDEAYQWQFGPNDALALAWTNPDAEEIAWGLTLGVLEWA